MRDLYALRPSKLDAETLDRITAIALSHPTEAAQIFSSDQSMQSVRSCTVRWLQDDWIQSLLWACVREANEASFQVEVRNRAEIQLVEYTEAQSDHYDWHHDVQWYGQSEFDRKLSVTMQLSDTDAYEGGDFEFEEVKTTADFRTRGTVLIFPSYLRHKIHPVTRGKRQALVAWFYGPRWR